MNRKFPSALGVLAFLLFTAVNTSAQRMGSSSGSTSSGNGSIDVLVAGDDGQPLDVAVEVRVYPGGGGAGALIQRVSDGGRATFNGLAHGQYAIEASAPGYRNGDGGTIDVFGQGTTYSVEVHLERDSSTATNPYCTLGPILAPKAQKAEDKGVAALKAGKFTEAQQDLEETLKLAPANPTANFLLGYIYLQERSLGQSETYLMKAYSLDPNNERTLVALGQLRYEQRDYPKATEVMKAALAQDPAQWFAHWIIADSDLRQQDFEGASKEAQLAVQVGKGAANGAQLIQGEALAALGRNDEAIQVLESFVRQEPKNSAVPRAQTMIAALKAGGSPGQAAPVDASAGVPPSRGVEPAPGPSPLATP